jgi:hypothetical protein
MTDPTTDTRRALINARALHAAACAAFLAARDAKVPG